MTDLLKKSTKPIYESGNIFGNLELSSLDQEDHMLLNKIRTTSRDITFQNNKIHAIMYNCPEYKKPITKKLKFNKKKILNFSGIFKFPTLESFRLSKMSPTNSKILNLLSSKNPNKTIKHPSILKNQTKSSFLQDFNLNSKNQTKNMGTLKKKILNIEANSSRYFTQSPCLPSNKTNYESLTYTTNLDQSITQNLTNQGFGNSREILIVDSVSEHLANQKYDSKVYSPNPKETMKSSITDLKDQLQRSIPLILNKNKKQVKNLQKQIKKNKYIPTYIDKEQKLKEKERKILKNNLKDNFKYYKEKPIVILKYESTKLQKPLASSDHKNVFQQNFYLDKLNLPSHIKFKQIIFNRYNETLENSNKKNILKKSENIIPLDYLNGKFKQFNKLTEKEILDLAKKLKEINQKNIKSLVDTF